MVDGRDQIVKGKLEIGHAEVIQAHRREGFKLADQIVAHIADRSPKKWRHVTLGGTAWPILFSLIAGPLISRFSDRWSGLLLWWKPFDRQDVDTLTAMIAAGQVKPVIDRRFPLDDVAAALRYVDDGHATGKVVITF